jgi:hypothetical protein
LGTPLLDRAYSINVLKNLQVPLEIPRAKVKTAAKQRKVSGPKGCYIQINVFYDHAQSPHHLATKNKSRHFCSKYKIQHQNDVIPSGTFIVCSQKRAQKEIGGAKIA